MAPCYESSTGGGVPANGKEMEKFAPLSGSAEHEKELAFVLWFSCEGRNASFSKKTRSKCDRFKK